MQLIELRDALRRLRDALHWTQEEMARRMGTTVRTIARWESGPVNTLPFGMLIHLRHIALQANREDLAGYFDSLLQKSRADDTTVLAVAGSVYEYLPANRRELELMGQLLGGIRKADPEIEPVLAQLDELRKQHLHLEMAKLLILHLEYTKLNQALKEHQQALEQRTSIEQGQLARLRALASGAQSESPEMFIPKNQADWDDWWSRLSPGLQAIYSPVYSQDEFDRVRRDAELAKYLMLRKFDPTLALANMRRAGLAGEPVRPPDADTVTDLPAGSPHKKREKS